MLFFIECVVIFGKVSSCLLYKSVPAIKEISFCTSTLVGKKITSAHESSYVTVKVSMEYYNKTTNRSSSPCAGSYGHFLRRLNLLLRDVYKWWVCTQPNTWSNHLSAPHLMQRDVGNALRYQHDIHRGKLVHVITRKFYQAPPAECALCYFSIHSFYRIYVTYIYHTIYITVWRSFIYRL